MHPKIAAALPNLPLLTREHVEEAARVAVKVGSDAQRAIATGNVATARRLAGCAASYALSALDMIEEQIPAGI